MELEVIEETVSDMVTKKNLKISRILNESCNSFTLPQISDDNIETLYLEKGSETFQKSAHESIDKLEFTLLVFLQSTPNLPNSIAKFNAIEANLMAIKSDFMDKVYELRNEISSLKSVFNNLISNCTETDNQMNTDTLNNNIVETKIVFLEKENSLLRSEIQNKKATIQKLLKNNTTLVESINTNLILPTQNKIDFIKLVPHEKENKDQWRIQRLIWAHREREARAWENQLGVCKPPSGYRAEPCWWMGGSPRKILTIYWLKSRF